MTDIVDKQTRSRMMAGIKGKNTKPELVLRRALHARGFRYRLPAFTGSYLGQGSTEGTYSLIVAGAAADAGDVFAQRMIATCARTLSDAAQPNLDGVPGTWLPVYAEPADWASNALACRFDDIEMEPSHPEPDGPYAVIGRDEALDAARRPPSDARPER